MRRKKRIQRDIASILVLLLGALLLLPVLSVTAKASYRAWTPQQERAHEIAQLARDIGLPENDPIIVRASELWWNEYNAKAYIPDWTVKPVEESTGARNEDT